MHPGYYFLLGDAPWPEDDTGRPDVVRVYWNVRSGGAAPLVAAISRELNAVTAPFWAKVRDSPDGHGRADSAVLYVFRDSFAHLRDRLATVLERVDEHLVDAVPMFTKEVATGVGVAEDPGNGLSFGQHRCELVARGLWQAHRDGRNDPTKRHEAIERQFRDAGLDPTRPYLSRSLRQGASDEYFLVAGTTQQAAGAAAGDATTGDTDSERFLRAASRLGVLLCDAAYWNRPAGRCGWLGRTQDLAAFSTSSTPRPLAATLGPDLYNGLSGIALFLAELFAQTSDELFRRTALGAIAGARHQVRSKLAAGEPLGLGFFTGVSGVTYAARRVGSLTGSVEELPEMRQMLVAALASARERRNDDIISGRAGAILTLLALDGDPAFAGWVEHAVELGRELVDSLRSQNMLTGLAHGAAGFGCALLALYSRTDITEFLVAGRAVLAWEDSAFDPVEGNWPDLREPLPGAPAAQGKRSVVTWCNGAAGIALSRLRAMAADPAHGADYARQATVGAAPDPVRPCAPSSGRRTTRPCATAARA